MSSVEVGPQRPANIFRAVRGEVLSDATLQEQFVPAP
jgi:hypothetical protein